MQTTFDAGRALLGRETFDSAALFARYPPVIRHPGKKVLFGIASAGGRAPSGPLVVSRFGPLQIPGALPASTPLLTEIGDYYRYNRVPVGSIGWHVNFADPDLFYAYGSAAFAQDEIQVAEHPVLGSLREALLRAEHASVAPRTMEQGQPTPVLVQGAERWCAIDTDPELAMPYGIYGRRFHRASPEVLREAVRPLNPPSHTNLIAMAAPPGGSGVYTRADIETILTTALTGFAAARYESDNLANPAPRVVVHTGHWGTGAFGGDQVLMAVLQIVAARLAGIDELVYHTVDASGAGSLREGTQIATQLGSAGTAVSTVIEAVVALGFRWGVSDGN